MIYVVKGHLDEQFRQVEDLQDEASPNFVEEVAVLFFKDSGRLISNLEQALEKYPRDFNRWDAYMQQLKGSCSSIGASRMKSECMSFKDNCGKGNVEGIFTTICRKLKSMRGSDAAGIGAFDLYILQNIKKISKG
ncbi:pseudo histidine-containing phosphotransfer protein 1-like [Lolium rigidum]|uniref:pseudo histidine-containing phosphotransfer protein 1-like n=1 Tax=Lolium rigidum TaxID=89674 RepID=UPI001F5E0AB5|nr:pseudo histidine-containing phosphotransfer protein 1-like [Lolium rigidum]